MPDLRTTRHTLLDRLGSSGVTIGPGSDGSGMSCAGG
jgi:hypothetical protein